MLPSWRLGQFFVGGRHLAPVVALLSLLWPAAGCGGPGSTSVVLFDEAGNEQISGAQLAGYQLAPAFPLIYAYSVAVLRPEPSGSDGGHIDPRQLTLGLRVQYAVQIADTEQCN